MICFISWHHGYTCCTCYNDNKCVLILMSSYSILFSWVNFLTHPACPAADRHVKVSLLLICSRTCRAAPGTAPGFTPSQSQLDGAWYLRSLWDPKTNGSGGWKRLPESDPRPGCVSHLPGGSAAETSACVLLQVCLRMKFCFIDQNMTLCRVTGPASARPAADP